MSFDKLFDGSNAHLLPEQAARIAELEAELKEAKQEAFNSGAMVLHLRDEVARLNEAASKTIGLLTAECDQLRQKLEAAQGHDYTDAELTAIYNKANGINGGKNPPITTERIFAAMRAIAPPPQPVAVPDINAMVNRFLCWKLPKDFVPDAGISFVESWPPESPHWPIGTNLFTADQAKAMFEYALAAAPEVQQT